MQKITTQFFLQVFLCNNAASYQDYVASVVDEWNMSMEHWWEGRDRKKLKYLGGVGRNKTCTSATCFTIHHGWTVLGLIQMCAGEVSD
jgi:hypothetical protein